MFYYVFDVMVLAGRDVMSETLERRRELLETKVLAHLSEPVRMSPTLDASLDTLVRSVREQGLEGLVAKRRDSRYEPGLRSGAWKKMRVNQGQEFVSGGYTLGAKNFNALIFGCYEGGKLMYAARTRNGFTPRSREELFARLRPLEIPDCPFANLPEPRGGRWGQGRSAANRIRAAIADSRRDNTSNHGGEIIAGSILRHSLYKATRSRGAPTSPQFGWRKGFVYLAAVIDCSTRAAPV